MNENKVEITERKRTERALRESEERFRLAAQAGRMFAYSWDAATDAIERSGESARILGIDEAAPLTGHQAIGRVHPDDRNGLLTAIAALSTEKPSLQVTYRIVRPDESAIWVERHSRAYFGEHGKVKRIVGMIVDISERKRAEEAIKESEQRFRLVADSAPVMIWMSGLDKRPTYFSQPWLDFTGLSEPALQNDLAGIVHPEDYEKCHETYCRGFDQRRPFRKECRLRRHDGQYRWMLDIGVPSFHEDGSFAGYIGSCVDITEQKLAEDAHAKLSRRLIEVQDEERRAVARELHDDITQRISLLAFDLKFLQQNLPSSRDVLQERLGEEYRRVSELVSDIDALSRRLHSSTLQRLGLTKAAEVLCRELSQRENLQIAFSWEGTPADIPEATSFCLFRVLQEALHNAARHSEARRIEVQLTEKPGEIHLIVSDSGKGFKIDSAKQSGGLGLTSMQERVRLLGGTIAIDSKPMAGTTIHVCVPLGEERNSQKAHA
jgi:PAS domain S-box-containing protein